MLFAETPLRLSNLPSGREMERKTERKNFVPKIGSRDSFVRNYPESKVEVPKSLI